MIALFCANCGKFREFVLSIDSVKKEWVYYKRGYRWFGNYECTACKRIIVAEATGGETYEKN